MFPQRLKQLRMGKKLSQQDMADFLGITRQGYAKYENSDSEPSFEMLKKMATFFGVTTDDLLGGEKNRLITLVISMSKRQGELENEEKHNYLTDKEKEEYELIQEFFKENPNDDITTIIQKCEELKEFNKNFEAENKPRKVSVAGQEFELTKEEYDVFVELKKHKIMFHDLASNPEIKVKELIMLYKAKKILLNESDVDHGDGFGELED